MMRPSVHGRVTQPLVRPRTNLSMALLLLFVGDLIAALVPNGEVCATMQFSR